MPSDSTVSKGLSGRQIPIWRDAVAKSGLSKSAAIEEALRLFCLQQGLHLPSSAAHGGDRKSADFQVITLLNHLNFPDANHNFVYLAITGFSMAIINQALAGGLIEMGVESRRGEKRARLTGKGAEWLFANS